LDWTQAPQTFKNTFTWSYEPFNTEKQL